MTRLGHFGEASAFFALFARSDWGSAHVRTSGIEIFAARADGAHNPMAVPNEAEIPARLAGSTELRAPHIGTVAEIAPVGTKLTAGACYARLEVLGEPIELTVDEAAIIADHLLPVGSLAEFDQPLVRIH